MLRFLSEPSPQDLSRALRGMPVDETGSGSLWPPASGELVPQAVGLIFLQPSKFLRRGLVDLGCKK